MRFALAATALVALAFVPPAQAAACTPFDTTPNFTDNCYHEYVLYSVDQPEVDVLILPSASPYALRDSGLMEQSVENWDDGINTVATNMNMTWLANGLNLHWYSVGLDYVPPAALWDPEIVIVPAEFNPALLLGIGLQSPTSFCHHEPPPLLVDVGQDADSWRRMLVQNPDFHQHEESPWGMLSVECDYGGRICFAINTNFLWLPDNDNRQDMFDLNSHEFGHCLGIGHVGDAGDFTSNAYPSQDIMSYQSNPGPAFSVHCVSTLNVLALAQVYGHLLGEPGYPSWPVGYVHMNPANWSAPACTQPTSEYYDTDPITTADPLGPYDPMLSMSGNAAEGNFGVRVRFPEPIPSVCVVVFQTCPP